MFTGIIEEVGLVKAITNNKIVVKCSDILSQIAIGDSVAVNGVCLTVTAFDSAEFCADISPETYRITNLQNIKLNDFVNLERAMLANGRFGGHIVSGHIDGIGQIVSVISNSDFYDFEIKLAPTEARYVIKKGSITINGISLTVAEVVNDRVKLAIIPHTFENTNLKRLKIGDVVNVEVDIFAKYIEKFLSTSDNKSRIDVDFLQRNGFC